MKCKLSEICSFTTGKLNSNAAVENGKYPFFTCSPETLKINDYAFDQEAILLAGNNAEGNFNIKYYVGKFNAYQRTYVFSAAKNCYLKYLYYSLKLCLENFKQISQGTATKFLTAKILNSFEIELPSLDIQKKIASILTNLDDKIELNNAINYNLQQQAQAIFKSWLSQCEEYTKIGDLCDNILDYSKTPNAYVRLLNSSDVTEGVFPEIKLTQNNNLKGHFKKKFRQGDILYSEIRPRNHHYGYVLFNPEDYIASTRLMVIRNRPQMVSSALLYQYLLLPDVESEFTLKTETRSGTFPQGNFEDMAKIIVPYADVSKQQFVNMIITTIRHIIYKNQTENLKLANLRDTLLPKLMSGELDVSEVEI